MTTTPTRKLHIIQERIEADLKNVKTLWQHYRQYNSPENACWEYMYSGMMRYLESLNDLVKKIIKNEQ